MIGKTPTKEKGSCSVIIRVLFATRVVYGVSGSKDFVSDGLGHGHFFHVPHSSLNFRRLGGPSVLASLTWSERTTFEATFGFSAYLRAFYAT